MNEREADPTGAFDGGGAAGTKPERHGQSTSAGADRTTGVDDAEREVITSGTAATSEIGDPDAQRGGEARGDGRRSATVERGQPVAAPTPDRRPD